MTKCPIPWDKEFDKNKKYIWISETGKNTCQECKSLDGKIFTGDNVPLRPHPNCKCDAVEYKESNFNQNESNISEKNLKTNLDVNNNFELQDLQQKTNELEQKVTLLKGKIIKTNTIEDYDEYDAELEKILNEITNEKRKLQEIQKKYGEEPVIREIKKTIDEIQKQAYIVKQNIANIKKNLTYNALKIVAIPPKDIFDSGISFLEKSSICYNAAALWHISSSKFESEIAKEYIEQNGRIINKVSDLKDRNLEYFIKTKLTEQIGKNEARGIFFNTDSSLSTRIVQDD
ncbi:MAG: hypothetical protein K6C94_07030, partial [Candidatus Gastranaerophilales bacterium]|nr:hypothetical protein [Candidatus Gastranaerophilales bacterium]